MADGMIEKYFKNEPATLGFKKGNILHRATQANVGEGVNVGRRGEERRKRRRRRERKKCECIFASLGDLQVYMVISIRRRPSGFTGSLEGGGGGGRTKTSMAPPASEEDAAYHFKGPVPVTEMDRELNKQTNKQTRVRLEKTRSCCSSVRPSVSPPPVAGLVNAAVLIPVLTFRIIIHYVSQVVHPPPNPFQP